MVNRLRLDADPTNATGNDLTMVKNAINRAYYDTCITTEFVQTKTTVSPTSGGSYTLGSTIIRPKLYQLTVGSVVYRPLEYRSLEDILRFRAANTNSPQTGPPQYFTMDGTQTIEVYPNFQGNETMDIWAVNAPTALSATTDVPVIPEPYGSACLVYGACTELADFTKDLLTGMQGYEAGYQMWLSKLRVHVNRRRGSNAQKMFAMPMSTIIPHDPSTDDRSYR